MTTLNKIYLLLLIFALSACEEPIDDKLQNKWWLEISDGDQIIQFLADGKAQDLNYQTVIDYQVDGETLTLDDQKFKINRLDENYLELSSDGKDLKFRLANSKDLLIGDWEGIYYDDEFSVDLRKDGDFKSKVNDERKRGKYHISNDTLKLGDEEFKFIISKDLNNLTLTLLKDENLKLELYRDL